MLAEDEREAAVQMLEELKQEVERAEQRRAAQQHLEQTQEEQFMRRMQLLETELEWRRPWWQQGESGQDYYPSDAIEGVTSQHLQSQGLQKTWHHQQPREEQQQWEHQATFEAIHYYMVINPSNARERTERNSRKLSTILPGMPLSMINGDYEYAQTEQRTDYTSENAF
jgi:hypothetical protein